MSTTTMVGIYETDVFGCKAYHCRCLACGWESRRFDLESTAVKTAQRHVCGQTPVKRDQNKQRY